MRERLGIIRQDLRHALRGLRRAPRFTASAILTLGLGLGAATVVFSVVDHVVLRSLPFESPDELFVLVDAAVNDSLLLKDLRTFFDRQTGTHDEVWVFRVNARHPLAAKLLEG